MHHYVTRALLGLLCVSSLSLASCAGTELSDAGSDASVDSAADTSGDSAADTASDALADSSADSTADALADTSTDTPPDTADDTEPPGPMLAQEMRGIWITRFGWSDQASLEGVINRAADAGFNAVFVQIRGAADAYYRSTRVPWAKRLSGTLGRDPGWDPLQVAIDTAHARGIEMHAYFNALTGWAPNDSPIDQAEGDIQHMLYDHPEWKAVTEAGSDMGEDYIWISPADPAARAHIVADARELLMNYEVDGLHLDRIRMSGREFSYDAATLAAWQSASAADPSLDRATWVRAHMRESVNALVREINEEIVRTRPSTKYSAAVWGIYAREVLGDCSGGVSQGLHDYAQDSLEWVREGYMDALVPMMYWPMNDGRCTDWRLLLSSFQDGSHSRHVWAGMHALDITNSYAWDWEGVTSRIEHSRTAGAQGTVVFATNYYEDREDGWDGYVGSEAAPGPFAEPAEVPAMPWK